MSAEMDVQQPAATEKKPRAPVVRNSTQRNGVQFHIHRSRDDTVSRWTKSIEVARNRLEATRAEEAEKIDGLLINFPWWMENNEEVVRGLYALDNVREVIQDGFVGVWTDSAHTGRVVDFLHNVCGVPFSNITKQMTIDYSTRYNTISETGVVMAEYESPMILASKRKAEEVLEEGEVTDDAYRGVERVSANITDTEYRTLTRPTTEDLIVGYIGDPSKLFANTPQCRIPHAVWHVNVFEEMAKTKKTILEARHPVEIRKHIERAFKASTRILELFDSTLSSFQIVAPFAPGIYYNPMIGKAREKQPVDLTLFLIGATENKFPASQVKKMVELVRKILNPNVTEKGRTDANTKLQALLSPSGGWEDFLNLKGDTFDGIVKMLGVEDLEIPQLLEKINFFQAMEIALTNVLGRQATTRERKRVKRADADPSVEKPRRGFNLPIHFSDKLAEFLGTNDIPRTQVNKMVNEYVAANELQCPDDKRWFVPDAKLAEVLGTTEKVQYFNDLPKLLNPHFPPSKKKQQELEQAASVECA